MLLDKAGKLVKSLDFRGTKIEYLDRISAKDLFSIITAALEAVGGNETKQTFKARDLAPKNWVKTAFEPILNACREEDGKISLESTKNAYRLFGVIIKQALIISPLLFRQQGSDNDYEGILYIREFLLA